jgi:flagellar biosynthesis/type III secretory pathway M-ring protein FliF/YscJ
MTDTKKPEYISIYEAPKSSSNTDLIDPASVEGRMASKMVRSATRLVDQHPEDAVRVLRGWLREG